MASPFSSVADILRTRAEEQPDYPMYIILGDGNGEVTQWTCKDTLVQALKVAAYLQAQGLEAGDRVLFVLTSAQAFISAVYGCLLAGGISTMAIPSKPGRPLAHLSLVAADAGARFVLADAPLQVDLSPQIQADPVLRQLTWLAPEDAESTDPGAYRGPAIDMQSPSSLLYTSGSTGDPKGVITNQAYTVARLAPYVRVVPAEHPSRALSWTPLYHTAGLSGIISTLLWNSTTYLLNTQSVIERPVRLLQAVDRHKITTLLCPPSMCHMILNYTVPAELAGLNLSSINALTVTSERADADLLERFAAYLEPYGLDRRVIRVIYALTESLGTGTGSLTGPKVWTTLYVDRAELEQGKVRPVAAAEKGAVPVVGCNAPAPGGEICIVDPETRLLCPPDQIGEIWMRNRLLALGYWNRPKETEATFQAHLADTGAGPYLRTGDMGFFNNGELFVTGRLKEMIRLRARSFFAQDIEAAVAHCHSALIAGAGAAIPLILGAEEYLAIIQEVKREDLNDGGEAVAEAMRQAVAEAIQEPVAAILLVEPGSLPRTHTQKIQRYRCKEAFEKRELKPIHSSILPGIFVNLFSPPLTYAPPRHGIDRALIGIWRGILNIEGGSSRPIGIQDNFFKLGGNSLRATQMLNQVNEVFLVGIPVSEFFLRPTITFLAEKITSARQPQP